MLVVSELGSLWLGVVAGGPVWPGEVRGNSELGSLLSPGGVELPGLEVTVVSKPGSVPGDSELGSLLSPGGVKLPGLEVTVVSKLDSGVVVRSFTRFSVGFVSISGVWGLVVIEPLGLEVTVENVVVTSGPKVADRSSFGVVSYGDLEPSHTFRSQHSFPTLTFLHRFGSSIKISSQVTW